MDYSAERVARFCRMVEHVSCGAFFDFSDNTFPQSLLFCTSGCACVTVCSSNSEEVAHESSTVRLIRLYLVRVGNYYGMLF